MGNKNQSRAKNLSDEDIAKIVKIIDGWNGRLCWAKLVDKIAQTLGARYTRQALHRHERIRSAFSVYRNGGWREEVAGGLARPPSSPELGAALSRIARLEAENRRITDENERLLEQFVRWSYNAHIRGLKEAQLNLALPPVDRRRTAREGR